MIDIMEIFGYFGIFIINLLIGYFLGYTRAKPQSLDDLPKKLRDKIKGKPKVGVISRPTAEELRKRGTIDEKGDQAMKEILEKTLPKTQ